MNMKERIKSKEKRGVKEREGKNDVRQEEEE